jgi:hypothetical protein
MYTPALQPYPEARDEAVAASGLLLSRQEHVHVGSTERALTSYDRTRAPLAQSAEHIHGKEKPRAILLVR